MNEFFLKIVSAKISKSDFEKYQLPIPESNSNDSFEMIFYTEADFFRYLSELENESSVFLSQYWMVKTQELIDKNKFIIMVLTAMTVERSKNITA